MKRLLMSLMAIIITIITVGVMYLSTFKLDNKNNFSKGQEIENKKNIQIENKDKDNQQDSKNKDLKKDDKKIDNKISKDEEINKIEKNKERLKQDEDNNSDKIEKKESSSVFKVNKHTLLKNLPTKDKIKLLYMCKGLSTIDMANIKEYMKSSNEIEASSEIFKILRQRLSKEDYNEIKKILNPYVNIEFIESNI